MIFAKRSLAMTITITAFEQIPGPRQRTGARHARPLGARRSGTAVRRSTAVFPPDERSQAHLALHPFGQIPTYEEGDLVLFETGAIVFHIAESHAGLLPKDANARARAIAWMFAALNTIELPIL